MMHVATKHSPEINHNCRGEWWEVGALSQCSTRELWWVFDDGRQVSDKDLRIWIARTLPYYLNPVGPVVLECHTQAWSKAHPLEPVKESLDAFLSDRKWNCPEPMDRVTVGKLIELERLAHRAQATSELIDMTPEECAKFNPENYDIVLNGLDGKFGIDFL